VALTMQARDNHIVARLAFAASENIIFR